MDTTTQIEILRMAQHILWLVSAFWLGYEIGQQKAITKLLNKHLHDLAEFREKGKFNEYTRATKTNKR